jgi:RNA polymerase sigma-70 factor (ECF subfamily)
MAQDFDTSAQEDRSWILKSRKGKLAAFDQLVLKYQKPLYFLVLKMVGNPADAQDVAQEAFIRAFRSLDRFDAERPFQPWLYRIAINLALTLINRRKQHASMTLEDAEIMGNPVTSDPPDRDTEELGQIALRASQALPEDHRAVLLLRAQEGLSYDQIAEVLEIPIGTVMSRLNRARSKLKELLKDYL